MDQDERDLILHSMVMGLHALCFGVSSMRDPKYALEAIDDGGTIHEYVHAMVRLLPPKPGENGNG